MKILNFGSLNIDYLYKLDHIVLPGETEHSDSLTTLCGGKGLNQSIALARAGAQVYHAGNVGNDDGEILLTALKKAGTDTRFVRRISGPSGHALIQVDKSGQNSIILLGGANQAVDEKQIEDTLDFFEPGDVIVLQNEINMLEVIMTKAHEKGMLIALNPSPFVDKLCDLPLMWVDYLFINEIEAVGILQSMALKSMAEFSKKFPKTWVVLTQGGDGVDVFVDGGSVHCDAEKVVPKDTTAAGDTFTGYFLSSHLSGASVMKSAKIATKAAAICISKYGAADSIPSRAEVDYIK